MLKMAASSGLSIDWGALGLVIVAALVAALVIVAFFSVALRLLAGDAAASTGADPSTGTSATPSAAPRGSVATIGAFGCIAVCVAAVLYGLYLVIPLFH